MKNIYFDYAATTPCAPQVVKAMLPFLSEEFGNSLSPHACGRRARKATEGAREALAHLLGAKPQEIVFTASASESNNTVIFGVARALKHKGRHLIMSAIEHHSILEPAKRLAQEGYEISYAPVDAEGLLDPKVIETMIRPETILVAVGHANNEIGVVQPIETIGRMLRDKGVYFLVDAVQTVGHIPVDVMHLYADFLSLSAHKFYGPQGVGALYVRQGVACDPLILGGDQERMRRAGTLNVAGIVGLGEAANLASHLMLKEASTQVLLREEIIQFVKREIPLAKLNGHATERLPNNVHFSFAGVDGEELMASLDMLGIYCSMGSACTSGQLTPSHVLKAIGLEDALATSSLRITLGRSTTKEDVQYLLNQLKIKVAQLCSRK